MSNQCKLIIALFLSCWCSSNIFGAGHLEFGNLNKLSEKVNSYSNDAWPCILPTGLEIIFSSTRSGGNGGYDLWVTARPSKDASWEIPVKLGSNINSSISEVSPSIATDGLSLYFSDYYADSDRPGGCGGGDIWVSTRKTLSEPFEMPTNIGDKVNSSSYDGMPYISADEHSLYFTSVRSGGQGGADLWITKRETIDSEWGLPVNLKNLNTANNDGWPVVSTDGLVIIFGSDRYGGYGGYDLWMATRKSVQDDWGNPVNLGREINTNENELGTSIARDASALYIFALRAGIYDIWELPILALPGDFGPNGDVDVKDFAMLAQSWLATKEDLNWNPACDISNPEDGTIDIYDLQVFTENWLVDSAFVGYWRLNESGGDIAVDSSAYGRKGTLLNMDDSDWVEGKVGNALSFDGVDDFVQISGYMGIGGGDSRSVCAWIQTFDTAGEIVSWGSSVEVGGRWIVRTEGSGFLRVEVNGAFIVGSTVVCDGQWHHVAVVLENDGSPNINEIRLYVDGLEEVPSANNFNLEVNTILGPDVTIGMWVPSLRYFEGLIDDVRIYERVISAEEISKFAGQ